MTSWRQRMWGHFHLLSFAQSEGSRGGGSAGSEGVVAAEVGWRKVVMDRVEGGREGRRH